MTARFLLLALSAVFLTTAEPAAAQSRGPALSAAEAAGIPMGCWQTRTRLYGAYSVAFCLSESGSGLYRVEGEGYDCQGRAAWGVTSDRRNVVFQMRRGGCGAAAEWTADRVECSLGRDPAGDILCTYLPNAPGFNPIRFAAFAQRPE